MLTRMSAMVENHWIQGALNSLQERLRRPETFHSCTKLIATALLAVFLAPGCSSVRRWYDNGFKVGPNYCKPQASVACDWIDYQNPQINSASSHLSRWWSVFNDPYLDRLIETAYSQNISLRVAGARILAARAERGIAAGQLFPQSQGASGGYLHGQVPGGLPLPTSFNFWGSGLGAAWEVDFWGRYRRAIEAADAELDASIENYDDVMVVLLSEVASSYTQVRSNQDRLRFAWLNVVSQYDGYLLAAEKFVNEATTARDLNQAKQVLEQTRSVVPQLESNIRQANNQLCLLLGTPPHELNEIEVGTYERELLPLKEAITQRVKQIDHIVTNFIKNRDKTFEALPGLMDDEHDPEVAMLLKPLEARQRTPVAPAEVIVGIPADLIRRRPDIRRAERQVAAQSALIGVAEADFYPRFSIVGFVGGLSTDFSDLFSSKSYTGLIAPNFQWSILNYGRIQNNVELQDARCQALAFEYQNAVLRAGKEVEDGVVGYLKSQEQTAHLYESVAAAERTVRISFEQYRAGSIDLTPVVLFESTLANQQDTLAVSRANIVLNLIAVYRSLGGGWEMRLGGQDTDQIDAQPSLPPTIGPPVEPIFIPAAPAVEEK